MRALWLVLLVGCGNNQLVTDLPDLAVQGPAAGALGAPCSSDGQCTFGVCLAIGRCSHTCPLPECELGWVCAPAPNRASPVCQCPTLSNEECNGIDDDCNGVADDNALCPGGGACVNAKCVCENPTGNQHAQVVADAIMLPEVRTEYAVDLNGDGRVDNQYGNILGALIAQGLSPQTDVNEQVDSGQLLLLVDLRSADPSFGADSCAGAMVTYAQPKVAPDFSGNGSFSVDGSVAPGNFAGPIATSKFLSAAPATAVSPVSLEVYLPLVSFTPGTPASKIPLSAAQLSFNYATRRGQLNGVIRKQDLDSVTAGAAAVIDQRLQTDPNSQTSQQIRSIFDTGGAASASCGQTCQNPDGSCAVKQDGHISICEVTTNSIIKNLLAPDVDMFDAAGHYAPNPQNSDKDSLSVGFGFTAVSASF